MRAGVISCAPDASLRTVARIMATNHVHSVVVTAGADAPVGVVTDRELLAAAGPGAEDRTAASVATDAVTAFADDTLADAARTLVDRGLSHLIVVDAASRPLGVLSALDVAGVLAWGKA
jgi:CBS domain-containing protein